MKRIIILCLVLLLSAALTACGGVGSYSGSRLGNDSELVMEYSEFNSTDSQLLELERGDTIDADIVSLAGTLSIKIQKDDEDPIYEKTDVHTGTFQVEIEESGSYNIIVKGEKARGSVSFKRGTGASMESRVE